MAGAVFYYAKSQSRAAKGTVELTTKPRYMPVVERDSRSSGIGSSAKDWGNDEANWEDVRAAKGDKW